MEPKEAKELYEHPANQLIAKMQLEHIGALDRSIGLIEKAVLESAREIPLYQKLLTLPGIGKILAMTMTMEVGEIARFKTDGDFASYTKSSAACGSQRPPGVTQINDQRVR